MMYLLSLPLSFLAGRRLWLGITHTKHAHHHFGRILLISHLLLHLCPLFWFESLHHFRHEHHQTKTDNHHQNHRILQQGHRIESRLLLKVFKFRMSSQNEGMGNNLLGSTWIGVFNALGGGRCLDGGISTFYIAVSVVVSQPLNFDLSELILMRMHIQDVNAGWDLIKGKSSVWGLGVCGELTTIENDLCRIDR